MVKKLKWHYRSNWFGLGPGAFGLLLVTVLSSCQTAVRHQVQKSPEHEWPIAGRDAPLRNEIQVEKETRSDRGAETPAGESSALPDLAPSAPARFRPESAGVILGPGGTRALAHVGLLKAFSDARIPIRHIVGLEWGALVGAIYSQYAKTHDLEWKLYKLEQTHFSNRGLLSTGIVAQDVRNLDAYLKANLGSVSFGELKISFACPAVSLASGTLAWQAFGELPAGIQKCLPFPPGFKAYDAFYAAAFSAEESVQYLKAQGVDWIIYVDVLGDPRVFSANDQNEHPEAALLWQALRRESLQMRNMTGVDYVEIPTGRADIFDLSARKELVSRGLKAGKQAIENFKARYEL